MNKVFGQQLKRLEYKRGVMSSKTRIITQGYINTFLSRIHWEHNLNHNQDQDSVN